MAKSHVKGKAQTVLGLIDGSELGITLVWLQSALSQGHPKAVGR